MKDGIPGGKAGGAAGEAGAAGPAKAFGPPIGGSKRGSGACSNRSGP
ncbi:hypothetical protein GCM10029963_45510 [Micromonospora andamanensis]